MGRGFADGGTSGEGGLGRGKVLNGPLPRRESDSERWLVKGQVLPDVKNHNHPRSRLTQPCDPPLLFRGSRDVTTVHGLTKVPLNGLGWQQEPDFYLV